MDLTRKQLINIDPKVSQFGGPANAFTHIRAFPTAEMRAVVRPNFDTLYSSAWLDLTDGPVVVSTSDTGAAISCCRCSICGLMCSPYRANGPTARLLPISRSCHWAGAEISRWTRNGSTRQRRMF